MTIQRRSRWRRSLIPTIAGSVALAGMALTAASITPAQAARAAACVHGLG